MHLEELPNYICNNRHIGVSLKKDQFSTGYLHQNYTIGIMPHSSLYIKFNLKENIMENNEILTSASSEEMLDTDSDYVAAINELKQNTVSKTEYTKLRAENKKLLDALVNGREIDLPKEEKVDVNDLRKKLFNKDANLSNLEYVDTALKLRTALIEQGERDPFLPVGDRVSETTEMYDIAQRVADGLQECVEFADGDSGIFTAQLQRITKDTPIKRRR